MEGFWQWIAASILLFDRGGCIEPQHADGLAHCILGSEQYYLGKQSIVEKACLCLSPGDS
jgi:hypothetical protein